MLLAVGLFGSEALAQPGCTWDGTTLTCPGQTLEDFCYLNPMNPLCSEEGGSGSGSGSGSGGGSGGGSNSGSNSSAGSESSGENSESSGNSEKQSKFQAFYDDCIDLHTRAKLDPSPCFAMAVGYGFDPCNNQHMVGVEGGLLGCGVWARGKLKRACLALEAAIVAGLAAFCD